jgi:signal transduction histidine kinase
MDHLKENIRTYNKMISSTTVKHEKNNEPEEATEACLNVANIYMAMSNPQQAEVYYLKGEKLCRELNDSTGLADVYQGLSSISIDKEDYPKALEYGEEAEHILSTLPNTPAYQLMAANQHLTDVWLKIPDYNKAMEYARKAVEYAKQTGVSSYLASALYSLSNCYLKQEKYKESEETAFQALATDTTEAYINSLLYRNIAQANIWLGNSAKGIEYLWKTTNAIRAYSNKNFQSSLSEMQVKYDTEKKELKITALEKERGLIIWLSIAGGAVLLLTLAAFFLLWRWTVQKRRAAEQQQQLAEQQVKQLEQEKQLVATQAVLDGETRERARLARDLHDGLGSMLTGAKLSLLEMKKAAKLESGDVERFDKAVGLLDDSVREMRRVAHHLMPDSLSRFGLKSAVSDFCSNFPVIRFAYYGDESRLDPKLEVMIYRSIHELVNNALKHAGAEKILVQIVREPGRIDFTVQDDGCGFDPSAVSKGMGLQNIRTRVASYNGVLDIDSNPGEGTEINVELSIEN